MTQVELLKQKVNNSNTVYLKFLQKYKFNSTEVHYIFEGFEDPSFYLNYIYGLSAKYETYISLGKTKSIELYNKIDWSKYDKDRVIIFIDRDYDRILGNPIPTDINLYETTFYSIENYISNPEILRRVINELFHYHEHDIIDQIITKFNNELQNYISAIKPVLAWILIIRSYNLKANLNEIDLAKLFSLNNDLSLITFKVDKLSYLEKVTQVKTPKVSFSVFKSWYVLIDSLSEYKLFMRGKFDMWFFVTFLNKLVHYLQSVHNHNSKVKTNINYTNAIEVLGPRTPIPLRLQQFIESLN